MDWSTYYMHEWIIWYGLTEKEELKDDWFDLRIDEIKRKVDQWTRVCLIVTQHILMEKMEVM